MICYRCNDALSCKTPEAKVFRDEDGVTPCLECLQEMIQEQEESQEEVADYKRALYGEDYDSDEGFHHD